MNKTNQTRMHVSYGVSDIKTTVEFYSKFFNTAPVKVKDDYAKFLLDNPILNISFIRSEKTSPAKYLHLGFEVFDADELKRKLGNAMTHDLPIDEEKEVACCYARQDKFWVTDPDGYKWEVFLFKGDVDQNNPKYSDSNAEVCCAS